MRTNEKQAAVLAYGRAIQRKKQAAQRGYSNNAEEYHLTFDVFSAAPAAHDAGVKLVQTADTQETVRNVETKTMMTLPEIVIVILLVWAVIACAGYYYTIASILSAIAIVFSIGYAVGVRYGKV